MPTMSHCGPLLRALDQRSLQLVGSKSPLPAHRFKSLWKSLLSTLFLPTHMKNMPFKMFDIQGEDAKTQELNVFLIPNITLPQTGFSPKITLRARCHCSHLFFVEVTDQIINFKSSIFLFHVTKMSCIIQLQLQV